VVFCTRLGSPRRRLILRSGKKKRKKKVRHHVYNLEKGGREKRIAIARRPSLTRGERRGDNLLAHYSFCKGEKKKGRSLVPAFPPPLLSQRGVGGEVKGKGRKEVRGRILFLNLEERKREKRRKRWVSQTFQASGTRRKR